MAYKSPFLMPEYKAFMLQLVPIGAHACCVVRLQDGNTVVCGEKWFPFATIVRPSTSSSVGK